MTYLIEGETGDWEVIVGLEVRAIRRGYRFARVPVERRPRGSGRSRGNSWRNAVAMAWALMRLRWRIRD